MSTSRSRLTRSIQEIAKRDPELRRAIEATKPRGDQPSAAGVGTSDAERDRVCCDGSVSDDANPGTETRDTSEGGQDGLNADDPADILDMGPGSLAGITDCTTGEPVCFDGADWIPPDGWDSPTDPPTSPGYESGYYWTRLGECPSSTPCQVYVCLGVASGNCTVVSCAYNGDGTVTYSCAEAPQVSFTDGVEQNSCGASEEPYCTEVPYEDAWPTDGCVNLAIKGGSIVGSKYDPENDGTYSKPMSEIELCDEFGNSFYLRPSSSGGWKTINATKTAGYLWGSNGQKIAHIDGNEYSDPSI